MEFEQLSTLGQNGKKRLTEVWNPDGGSIWFKNILPKNIFSCYFNTFFIASFISFLNFLKYIKHIKHLFCDLYFIISIYKNHEG